MGCKPSERNIENAKELARRCVEAPKKPKPNAPPFSPRPSLETAVGFLIASVQRYPVEPCQVHSWLSKKALHTTQLL